MKKLIAFSLGLMAFTAVGQSTWKVDKAHSSIRFDISHLMISEVTGTFNDFDIEAVADESFNEPNFTVTIQTTSINTHNERRDNHLRSDDFFAAETHPTISFTTSSYEQTGDNTFSLTGDLTMHGTTKSVTLDGRLNGVITDQRSQKLKAGLKIKGTVNRKDFGIGSKPFPVGEEVDLTINLEMAQQ